MTFSTVDKKMMKLAIEEAFISKEKDEVPIGCVLTKNNALISAGHNLSIELSDPTAHAEIMVIRDACNKLENYRLVDCTMYTTLEPCLMCFGAIINSRIKRLVIGTIDEEHGAPISNKVLLDRLKFNHKIDIEIGLFSEECSSLLKNFFKEKRSKTKFCPNRGVI
ncbi:tRNA adenosine(34) deaminase TadA [SAR86 cluster bacterium]|nr:tRNA adenosine(34) deaminase TadA [SAR86 cluster bacterium]